MSETRKDIEQLRVGGMNLGVRFALLMTVREGALHCTHTPAPGRSAPCS